MESILGAIIYNFISGLIIINECDRFNIWTTGYFYYQYQKLTKRPVPAETAAQDEVRKLTTDIGKLMILPKDETPTVATVTDIDKLKD